MVAQRSPEGDLPPPYAACCGWPVRNGTRKCQTLLLEFVLTKPLGSSRERCPIKAWAPPVSLTSRHQPVEGECAAPRRLLPAEAARPPNSTDKEMPR